MPTTRSINSAKSQKFKVLESICPVSREQDPKKDSDDDELKTMPIPLTASVQLTA